MLEIELAAKVHPPEDPSLTTRLLRVVRRGAEAWNRWRSDHPEAYVDLRGVTLFGYGGSLRGADLSRANLSGANFARVDLRNADLSACYGPGIDFQGTDLTGANLRGAYLPESNFGFAHLDRADLRLAALSGCNLMNVDCNEANLRKASLQSANILWASFVDTIMAQADLSDAILREANLRGANLSSAQLVGASLVEANLSDCDLSGCHVYGSSVWRSDLTNANQSNLVITAEDEPEITVDNLKVAQFIHMILNNQEIREVIDSVTSKVVLIIGRFTQERKRVLDALRGELRRRNYTPVMFDFDRPVSRNFRETVSTLAGMARFIVADVTDAKVVLQELDAILKEYPSVPVQPILMKGAEPTAVLLDFTDYPAFLRIQQYLDEAELLESIVERVIEPAEAKAEEILHRRQDAERMLAQLQDDSMSHEEPLRRVELGSEKRDDGTGDWEPPQPSV